MRVKLVAINTTRFLNSRKCKIILLYEFSVNPFGPNLTDLFVNISFRKFRERDIMEKELNYLRSEIAKIRMEKEKAQFGTTG